MLTVVATVPTSLPALPPPPRSILWLTLVPTSDSDGLVDSDEYDGSMCAAGGGAVAASGTGMLGAPDTPRNEDGGAGT